MFIQTSFFIIEAIKLISIFNFINTSINNFNILINNTTEFILTNNVVYDIISIKYFVILSSGSFLSPTKLQYLDYSKLLIKTGISQFPSFNNY